MQPDSSDRQTIIREIAEHRAKIETLQQQLLMIPRERWKPEGYYAAYYGTAGFFLGMAAALTSLMFNIVGSAAVGQSPLKIIQIYLTFPLGERALELDGGLAMAIGCCLYVATGMVLGVPFYMALVRFTAKASLVQRLAVASAISLVLWLVNFYGVLSWLQPLLFGGNWIVELTPVYIAALTHLVFGWTMALMYPLGLYVPYQTPTKTSAEQS